MLVRLQVCTVNIKRDVLDEKKSEKICLKTSFRALILSLCDMLLYDMFHHTNSPVDIRALLITVVYP